MHADYARKRKRARAGGRLANGEPSSTPIEHNHTCGELELSFTVCLGSVLMCSVNEHDVADVPPCLRNPIVVSFRARTVRGHRSCPPPRWWRVLSSAVSGGVREGIVYGGTGRGQ
jgi:hypothetical protein